MTSPHLEPTFYSLSGNQTSIVYATTSFVGRPTFDYKNAHTELKLTGEQIRVVDSEFAKLVTVTVETTADAGDTTLTLLIPKIEVTQDEPKTTFDTKAIVMSLKRLGPVHQHYRILNLHGIAEARVF
jgi:hypothetical protein